MSTEEAFTAVAEAAAALDELDATITRCEAVVKDTRAIWAGYQRRLKEQKGQTT